MTTIEEQFGDLPLSRFGHTSTIVGGTHVILFGGATGDSGRYTITSDCYVLNVTTNSWQKLNSSENVPSARAAHASACVDQYQLVIYGGATGGGSLSPDELYLLDFRPDHVQSSTWMNVPVQGSTPGRRYGHTLVFHKPLLIIYGGNNGTTTINDIYYLNVEQTPFAWHKVLIDPLSKSPSPRVYHSAEICKEGPANGMMVIYGGRTIDNRSLKDSWGLRQHRNGKWDWIEAPSKRERNEKGEKMTVEGRFQHSVIFLGTKMIIVGGRGDDVSQPLPTSIYNTETCEWVHVSSINRFRHSVWSLHPNFIFAYGGFDHKNPSNPTNHLQVLDLSTYITGLQQTKRMAISSTPDMSGINQAMLSDTNNLKHRNSIGATVNLNNINSPINNRYNSAQNNTPNNNINNFSPISLGSSLDITQSPSHLPTAPQHAHSGKALNSRKSLPVIQREIKLSSQAVVSVEREFSHLVRKVSIDRLEEEGRKLNKYKPSKIKIQQDDDPNAFFNVIIDTLLNSKELDSNSFALTTEVISELCDHVLELMQQQPMMLHLRAPIKVYGDIHGQFFDLLRMFDSFQGPFEGANGDIETLDYLFLGDYVDRGAHSLETICLLFALKLRYPNQIHLLRGNHEDPNINSVYGFRTECSRRLHEDPDDINSCWSKFNIVFEWMPVGALIEEKILCIHGGIGGSINYLSDISNMQRPLQVSQIPNTDYEQKITDLLWSDPTDHDTMNGILLNDTRDPDGSGHILKFGPDRVTTFMDNNKLDLIIRAHECVMDGFERFAGGKLITLFSATDYCGHHKNAGALLFIRRDLTVVPKIIYPIERALNTVWDAVNIEQRPPTPPRPVPKARRDELE